MMWIARLRVRFKEALLVLALALPDILDALGVIDLSPLLRPIFGEERTGALTTIIMIVLAFLRPIVHLKPKDC